MPTPSIEVYREILLTKGQSCKVSLDDFDNLSLYKWQAFWNPHTSSFYARRTHRAVNVKQNLGMHSFILLGLCGGRLNPVDHINGDTLDNRRENLRICTPSQNCANSKKRSDNVSGYKGVSLHSKTGRWRAAICVNNSLKSLGLYFTAEAAHEAYCKASLFYHADFSRFE